MKNCWLILLVFVFPLQAALAAVQAYDGHGPEGVVTIESVLHTHAGLDHEQRHGSSVDQNVDDPSSKSPCSSDHHHCHAHNLTVLPSFSSFEFPPSALAQIFEHPQGNQSYLSNQIERPKWV